MARFILLLLTLTGPLSSLALPENCEKSILENITGLATSLAQSYLPKNSTYPKVIYFKDFTEKSRIFTALSYVAKDEEDAWKPTYQLLLLIDLNDKSVIWYHHRSSDHKILQASLDKADTDSVFISQGATILPETLREKSLELSDDELKSTFFEVIRMSRPRIEIIHTDIKSLKIIEQTPNSVLIENEDGKQTEYLY